MQISSMTGVSAGGLDWHVQDLGAGPPLLLIHGTGSSSHSWREVAPLLARQFRVIAPDLPGHGLTSTAGSVSLPAMSAAMSQLLKVMEVDPLLVAGHSAGAAVLVRMTLDGLIAPELMVGINAALLPFSGLPRWVFAPMARFLSRSTLIPRWAAHRARDVRVIERLIDQTGSRLDPAGVRLYQQLVQKPEHVAAALSMMANWDLETLARDIRQLRTPLHLLTSSGDRTIPASEASRVCNLTRCASITSLGPLGHLAHEERPALVAEQIVRLAMGAGVLS